MLLRESLHSPMSNKFLIIFIYIRLNFLSKIDIILIDIIVKFTKISRLSSQIPFLVCLVCIPSKADIRNPSLQLCWQGLASLLAHERSLFAICQWELSTPTDISIPLIRRLVLRALEAGECLSALKEMVGHSIQDITESTYTVRDVEWLRAENWVGGWPLVSWPANHTLLQVCLPLFVVVYHSSVGELPDPCFHLCLGFGVNSQGKPFPAFVEAISQKFYLSGICHCRFLPVHLQKQFLLDKRNDVFQGLIRTGFASAEDFPLF